MKKQVNLGASLAHHLLATVFALLALATSACGGSTPAATQLPGPTRSPSPMQTTMSGDLVIVKASGEQVSFRTVEVADTPELRTVGLSNRASLGEDTGMLFVFQVDVTTGFWMRNTMVPLSIAFIGADGRIVDIQDMQPLSDQVHYSAKPYRFALEVNQGLYTHRGVTTGDRAQVSERLRGRAPGLYPSPV